MALRIISGGQTGVDRGALDAALAAGVPCGGWCPRGRRAEDGRIPARYPLQETDSTAYVDRTRRNVADADATAIVYFGALQGGTARTVDFCRELGRPCLLLDATALDAEAAAQQLAAFVADHAVETLNVAGPRASRQADAAGYARTLLSRFIALYNAQGQPGEKA